MNLQKHIIIINDVDKTYQVETIQFDRYKYAIKFHNSDKIYSYLSDKVIWLTNPTLIDCDNCLIYIEGKIERNIKGVNEFADDANRYYAVTFENDFVRHYSCEEIEIRRSCLTGATNNILDYLRQCAAINTLGINEEDESSGGILSSIYSKIDFLDDTTAAAVYLNPEQRIRRSKIETPIFPFGCNASQERAVKAALTNQISVIQGPPGTGKTQTILNIIANLLKDKKTVLVVSNNNSATENVLEKLSKNGFGFLVAALGKKENKEAFIANQPPLNPELPSWRKSKMESVHAYRKVNESLEKIEKIFSMQERLAICRQELAEVKVEMTHYTHDSTTIFDTPTVKISSSKILKTVSRIKVFANTYQNNPTGFLNRLKLRIEKFCLELRLKYSLEINEELTAESVHKIISLLDLQFYNRKVYELESEISSLELALSQLDAEALMKSLTDDSMIILKATLAKRYNGNRQKIDSVKDLFDSGESVLKDFPIVLSTTFSSKTCFNSETLFDYVIMDEASQVSVETGLLALTCAKNAVIVGDTMQLPNVITEEDKIELEEIRKSYNIPESYDASIHSFLSSVLATIPDVPETLLREHYRCHPDIINFCNQKFYDGNLLIMTKRSDDDKHLMVLTTSPGQHCRGHYNQREIDAVKIELLPLLDNIDDTGIIAPYNSQVQQFRSQIPHIEVDTVHKYQGREKDIIVMSITDDVITQFTDNANLLNVAVSRAKRKFCLVVSGNPQELKGNIHDLVHYIKYQQGIVIESKLRSIFDYLFSKNQEFSRGNEPISEYRSENLTFDLIERIRAKYPHLSHIKVLCHYPLHYLIRDIQGLTEREIKYALHPSTHIDFLVINRVTKLPLLAIETDGYSFHNDTTEQYQRDRMKDRILDLIGLPLLRLSTIGHGEEQKIVEMLNKIINNNMGI